MTQKIGNKASDQLDQVLTNLLTPFSSTTTNRSEVVFSEKVVLFAEVGVTLGGFGIPETHYYSV